MFKHNLGNVRTGGGGDACEDVTGGIAQACNLDWKCANKIMFIVGDYPCHGMRFHQQEGWDWHPEGIGDTPDDVIRALKSKNIDATFFSVNDHCDMMIDEFNKIDAQYSIDLQHLEKDNLLASLTASMLSTITASMTNSRADAEGSCKFVEERSKFAAGMLGSMSLGTLNEEEGEDEDSDSFSSS